ncbi:hypothetical protein MNBD_GAMMA10-2332 [hydrothermal vent metagenome]|uniref:DUF4136 domain-containing protein n=1 Tax=hydrothermal vent metagenome TaxID=652676 RepID=A0A3B0Y6R3_9ZZZZ
MALHCSRQKLNIVYEQGTLILDFVSTAGKKLIWRATAKAVINPASTPEKQTERMNSGVTKILSEFPPKKAIN